MSESIFPRQIPFGMHTEGVKHAAFVCIHARDCKPYDVANPEIPDHLRHMRVNRFLLYSRHDDTIGWPGGSSEKEDFDHASDFVDGLKKAACREAKQEIGCDLKPEGLSPICSHYVEAKKAVHLFGYETDYDTLIRIARKAASDKKHFAESTGVLVSTALPWKKPDAADEIDLTRGIMARFQQPSPPAFRPELYQALTQLHLVDIDVLKEIERRFLPPGYLKSPMLSAIPKGYHPAG